ncbi:MAG: hypothetical protein HN737_11705 [Desulfobacterales bacterium]|jgi:putative sterol carrier protein/uncharacterized OB-fold protein|nr:hypothetical protein [Desulfobacteraceae bacterium]MBT7086004.1 hypothetical protein [Desulfobacterales bacterium]MBT7698060.1 hypothetical protein [Desulfobacterales bacterium]
MSSGTDQKVTIADIFGSMESRVNPDGVKGVTCNCGYKITGEGGGEYTVTVKDGDVKVLEGIHSPDVTTTASAENWINITLGKLDATTAFTSGMIKIDGDMGVMGKAAMFFQKYRPPAPEVTIQDIFGSMESRVNPEGVKGVTCKCGYDITGDGGGQYTVSVDDGNVKVLEGIHEPDVTTTSNAQNWIDITLGKLDATTAFTSGMIKIEGDMGVLGKAAMFFKKYIPPGGEIEEQEELLMLPKVISVPQKFNTGPKMGKFLKGLIDKKLYANKCPECKRLQIPPREVCAECIVRADEFVEVGPDGIIQVLDITFFASPDPLTGESRETPYVSAHILLDGCKGHETLWHELNPANIKTAKKGDRVRPVWNENRTGSVSDILYYELIE